MQPLRGLKVLDFSTLLPGPLAGLILADAGAEVIKIERPGIGDEMRHYPPSIEGNSALFALLNRGKTSLAVDLKTDAGRAQLAPHLATADILIEQFRPGVMARIGLDYDTLSKEHPGLIYCSITGFGQTGPKAQVAGHDLNYIAQTGLLSLSMGPVAAPVVPPALIADIAGGAYPAVMNILMALHARHASGQGAHLDVSMTDNLFPLMWWALGQRAVTGSSPGNADNLLTGGSPRYRLYPCSDGQIVAAAPIEQRFWKTFCTTIGLPADLQDDRSSASATLAAITEIIGAKPGAHWAKTFDGVDCCAMLVVSLDTALSDPHYQARGIGAGRTTLGALDIPALHTPLAPAFQPKDSKTAPNLGALGDDSAKA